MDSTQNTVAPDQDRGIVFGDSEAFVIEKTEF